MNKYRNFLLLISQVLILTACVSNPLVSNEVAPNQRPAWIDNPGNGASASAGMNVRGRVAQEEMAVMRAREEYAKRFGVSIDSVQGFATTVANDRASTTAAHVSHEETKQSDVKAVVKAKWRDEEADVLWVWVVPSN